MRGEVVSAAAQGGMSVLQAFQVWLVERRLLGVIFGGEEPAMGRGEA
jgi:hypothetical protein